MKKLFILVLTVFLSVNVFADVSNSKVEMNKNEVPMSINVKNLENSLGVEMLNKNNIKLQEYDDLVTVNAAFTYDIRTTPVAYDPYTNALIFTNYARDEDDNWVGIYYLSTDNGETWTTNTFYESTLGLYQTNGLIMVLPSVSVINPSKSNNVDDLYFTFHGPAYDINKPDDEQLQGGVLAIKTPDELFAIEDPGPQQNNPGSSQIWFGTETVNDVSNGNIMSYYYGTLIGGDNDPAGMYGVGNVDLSLPDFGSRIPQNWGLSTWRDVPDPTSGSFNGPLNIVVDENGHLYAVVYNWFRGDEVRIAGFSKSTDKGATWSDFNKMPRSVQDDFIYSLGGNPVHVQSGGQMPYQTNSVIMYGENDFGLITRLTINKDGQQDYAPAFVEARYKNGTWSMHKITDWSGSQTNVFSSTEQNGKTLDYWTINQRGNEIQTAVTADGQYHIIKYIDQAMEPEVYELSKQYQVYWFNTQTEEILEDVIAELTTNDIYITYKKVGENNWSEPKNVTDDFRFNKMTWIPKVVPSINEIPLFSTRLYGYFTNSFRTDGVNSPYNDELVTERIIGESQMVQISYFDLLESSVNDLDDQNNIESTVYPNPATESVKIKYTLDKPERVNLTLYDAAGNRIGLLLNSVLSAGEQEIGFNVNHLSNGTYIYKLSIGNNVESGKFQIVR